MCIKKQDKVLNIVTPENKYEIYKKKNQNFLFTKDVKRNGMHHSRDGRRISLGSIFPRSKEKRIFLFWDIYILLGKMISPVPAPI